MVKMDGAELRRQRLSEIAQTILRSLNQKSPLSLSETLASLQYRTGLTREKLLEYLDIMKDMGQFQVDSENDRILKSSEK